MSSVLGSAAHQGAAASLRAFGQVQINLKTAADDLSTQISSSAIEDEHGRLRVWIGNLGVMSHGHSSLDYRLRDAPLVLENVLKLLNDLYLTLMEMSLVLSGARLPYEHQPRPESDDDQSDTSSSSDDSSGSSLDTEDSSTPKSELHERFDTLTDIIDHLYKLSRSIRTPALRSATTKAALYKKVDRDTGVDLLTEMKAFDLAYTTEIWTQLRRYNGVASKDLEMTEQDHTMMQRVASSISRRRQQFMYWKRHHDKLSVQGALGHVDNFALAVPEVQKLQQSSQTPRHMSRIEHSAPEPAATKIQSLAPSDITRTALTATTATIFIPRDNMSDDGQTMTSVATTTRDIEGRKVELPAVPRGLRPNKDFECPYCFTICPAKYQNPRAWRKHILHDLRPYECTYPSCFQPDLTFWSRSEWIDHERSAHRRIWRCREHVEEHFPTVQKFEHHMQEVDHELLAHLSTAELADMSETTLDDPRTCCYICLASFGTSEELHNHLANHMERLAAFALPKHLDSNERDSQLSELDSDAVHPRSDEQESLEAISSYSLQQMRSDFDKTLTDIQTMLSKHNTWLPHVVRRVLAGIDVPSMTRDETVEQSTMLLQQIQTSIEMAQNAGDGNLSEDLREINQQINQQCKDLELYMVKALTNDSQQESQNENNWKKNDQGLQQSSLQTDMAIETPKIGTLVVIVDRAKNLQNESSFGLRQGLYCAVMFGKETKKTKRDGRSVQTLDWYKSTHTESTRLALTQEGRKQELRFDVRESSADYQLTATIFDDDKKNNLIGETWVNLEGVVKPGGGEKNVWHILRCKGIYAGEIRLEITYHDFQPKQDAANEQDVAQDLWKDTHEPMLTINQRPISVSTDTLHRALPPEEIGGPSDRPAEIIEDAAIRFRHSGVIKRASSLLQNDASKVEQFRNSLASFRASSINAAALLNSFLLLFPDTHSTAFGVLVQEVEDLYEDRTKADSLLTAWNDWHTAINKNYPPWASNISEDSAKEDFLKLVSNSSMIEGTLADCCNWYTRFLERKFRASWKSHACVVLPGASDSGFLYPRDFSILYRFVTIVAEYLIDMPQDKSLAKLANEVSAKMSRHLDNSTDVLMNLLVFYSVGWLTLLYEPLVNPTELQITGLMNSVKEIGGIKVIENYPLTLLIRRLGVDVPYSMSLDAVLSGYWISTFPPVFTTGITLIWADTLSEHLKLDVSTKQLKIFRYPSFCRIMYRATFQRRQHTTLFPFGGLARSEGPQNENYGNLCRDVFITYYLIFHTYFQSKAYEEVSWRHVETHLFSSTNGAYDDNTHPDPLLDTLFRASNLDKAVSVYREVGVHEEPGEFTFFSRQLYDLRDFLLDPSAHRTNSAIRQHDRPSEEFNVSSLISSAATTVGLSAPQVEKKKKRSQQGFFSKIFGGTGGSGTTDSGTG